MTNNLQIFFLGLIVAASILGVSRFTYADDFSDFANAKNAYDAGEYKTAVERFEALLKKDPANKALTIETHKLLGISYLFVENEEQAEIQFVTLLTKEFSFSLDPLVFPIDVVDFFTEIKHKHSERLAEMAIERAKEEKAIKKSEEEKKQRELEKLKRNVYLERTIKRSSWLMALLPLGSGQFQNGHKIKGIIFLSSELILGATAITTFILHSRLRPQSYKPFDLAVDKEEYENYETGYRITNQASIVALAIVAMAGIIDSVYYFEQTQETWRPLKENDVPVNLQPKVQPQVSKKVIIIPVLGKNIIGIGAARTF